MDGRTVFKPFKAAIALRFFLYLFSFLMKAGSRIQSCRARRLHRDTSSTHILPLIRTWKSMLSMLRKISTAPTMMMFDDESESAIEYCKLTKVTFNIVSLNKHCWLREKEMISNQSYINNFHEIIIHILKLGIQTILSMEGIFLGVSTKFSFLSNISYIKNVILTITHPMAYHFHLHRI